MKASKRLLEATMGIKPQDAPAAATPPASAPTAHLGSLPPPAAKVETGFPPAAKPAGSRTGPGQMLAFRGHMAEAEAAVADLRKQLEQHADSMPTKRLNPQSIHPSIWANRHEAAFATPAFRRFKAEIEQSGGNVQPILVRPRAGHSDQFEVVFGHRRHRACLELGLPVLACIWNTDLPDAALFAAMDRENRQRADLSPYEQGLMYRHALEEKLFLTNRQLAEGLGVSHTWVNKALSVAKLPDEVVQCFRSPLEIGHRHARELGPALEADGKAVLKRAIALQAEGGKLSADAVVARLIGAAPGSVDLATGKVLLKRGDDAIGTIQRRKGGGLTITLDSAAVVETDLQRLANVLAGALEKI